MDDPADLAVIALLGEVGLLGDYPLVRFAASREDFTTAEAAREISAEARPLIDRRAERLVGIGAMLERVGDGRPKRYAATPAARHAVAAVQAAIHGARIGHPPNRLICISPTPSVKPARIEQVLADAIEIYDSDGVFSVIGVFDDEPQLARDLLHRLHEVGVAAQEVRLAARRP